MKTIAGALDSLASARQVVGATQARVLDGQ